MRKLERGRLYIVIWRARIVSLNSRETVFLLNYQFFDKFFHEVFGHRKKPKAYKINLLLELASQGWSRVRTAVQQKFEQSKDALINLLENVIPLVLDFYPVIFRSGIGQHTEKRCFVFGLYFINIIVKTIISYRWRF